MKPIIIFLFTCIPVLIKAQTYAEKLGYPKGSKVIILHVDDAGMSFDSNEGVANAMLNGVANSTSIMMPCGWVPTSINTLALYRAQQSDFPTPQFVRKSFLGARSTGGGDGCYLCGKRLTQTRLRAQDSRRCHLAAVRPLG